MKIVLACEGKCEVVLIQSLLNKGQLSFKNEILLNEPRNIRQLTEIASVINMLPVDEEIVVFRIGDTLNEDFSFKGFELRKDYITVYKICTKTEIEILFIINEGYYKEFLKTKNTVHPKEFIKQKMKQFDFEKYVAEHDLLACIESYKKLKGKKHKKDEMSLYELINVLANLY